MARKQGTSVRNSDVVKPRSVKFEPSTIQTRTRTMQNLAHPQKTETTTTICTRSKAQENKPVMQRTKAILAQTRETEPTADCRKITRLGYAEARQKASENQAIGRKIADVRPIRPSAPIKPSKTKPLPKKKKDQVRSSIQSSCQKLAKSEAARKGGAAALANKIKANAVVAKTRKQTTSDKVQHNPLPSKERSTNASCPYMLGGSPKNKGPVQKRDSIKVRSRSVTMPSSKSELHTVAQCSTSVLHRRLCYDEKRRERIRRANMKKNQCKPEGACSPTVKQMISHSYYICPAAPRRDSSSSSLHSRRVFPFVRRKLVFDDGVPKLERVLHYTKSKVSYSEKSFQEEPVTVRSDDQHQASQRVFPCVRRKLVFDEESSKEFSTPEKEILSYHHKAYPPAPRNGKSTSFFDGRAVLSFLFRRLIKIIFGGDVFSPAPLEGKFITPFYGHGVVSTPLSRELIFDDDVSCPVGLRKGKSTSHIDGLAVSSALSRKLIFDVCFLSPVGGKSLSL